MRGSRIPDEIRKQIRAELEYKTKGQICKEHCISRTVVRKIEKEGHSGLA